MGGVADPTSITEEKEPWTQITQSTYSSRDETFALSTSRRHSWRQRYRIVWQRWPL